MNNSWHTNNYDQGSCCGLRTGFNAYLYTPNGLVKTGTLGAAATDAALGPGTN
jgi:hypothetical protein